jgi:hypothetical protein
VALGALDDFRGDLEKEGRGLARPQLVGVVHEILDLGLDLLVCVCACVCSVCDSVCDSVCVCEQRPCPRTRTAVRGHAAPTPGARMSAAALRWCMHGRPPPLAQPTAAPAIAASTCAHTNARTHTRTRAHTHERARTHTNARAHT